MWAVAQVQHCVGEYAPVFICGLAALDCHTLTPVEQRQTLCTLAGLSHRTFGDLKVLTLCRHSPALPRLRMAMVC